MPIICLIQTYNYSSINKFLGEWDPSLSWIGLLNWIPLFLIFGGVQPYLSTEKKRISASKYFIYGSFPVLISGLGQYFYEWHGPFETLYGLIIWYQRPIGLDGGLTGLFNNSNYAGSWFNIIWPFCIASFINSKNNFLQKTVSLLISIAISVCIVLTNSRNAWGGLILSLPLVMGPSIIYWIIGIAIFFISLFLIIFSSDFFSNLKHILDLPITNKFILEFTEANFLDRETRIKIWIYGIKLISQKPIFGWGAAIFPVLYFSKYQKWLGHSHNLFIQLAVSYGLIVSLVLLITFLLMIYKSFRKINIFRKDSSKYFEKAWWASFFVLFLSQLIDVQYFDGRISIAFWILLAGIREIIRDKKLTELTSK